MLDELPYLWKYTAHKFLEEIHLKSGWDWIYYLSYGDILNYLGMVFLAGLTIIAYIAITPLLFASAARAVGTIAIVEILILILAASGILQGGH